MVYYLAAHLYLVIAASSSFQYKFAKFSVAVILAVRAMRITIISQLSCLLKIHSSSLFVIPNSGTRKENEREKELLGLFVF